MLNQLIGQKCLSASFPVWDAASSGAGAEPLPHRLLWGCSRHGAAVPPQLSWGWCLVLEMLSVPGIEQLWQLPTNTQRAVLGHDPISPPLPLL